MCAIADSMTYIECGKMLERDIVIAGYEAACNELGSRSE